MDQLDLKLLDAIQTDCSRSLDELAESIGLSRNASWRRMKALEDSGIIRGRVALLDAEKLGLGLTVVISVRTSHHTAEWLDTFRMTVQSIPDVIAAFRTTGDIDYLLHAVVPDVAAYDRLYKALISAVPLSDVSSYFVMETLKSTTRLPLALAGRPGTAGR